MVLFCTVLGFALLRGFPLALTILMTFGGLIRADSVFVALVGLRCWVEGGFPPGQLLKTWTSLTLWPLSSGGWPQVALTFRLTCSIHLEAEGTIEGSYVSYWSKGPNILQVKTKNNLVWRHFEQNQAKIKVCFGS